MKVGRYVGRGLFRIMFAGGLLLIAFGVPDLLMRLEDRNSIGQVNTQKLEMDTYELTYHNFAEKLYTIAVAGAEGIATQLIQMPDDVKEISNEELTEHVVQEADELFEKMWGSKIELQPEELVKREFYMLHGGNGMNVLPGFYIYRLVYMTEWLGCDNVEVEFFLDAQFHKLYRFSVNNQYTNIVMEEETDFWQSVIRAREETLDEVLPLDVLVQYWELENSYSVEYKGDEFYWGEKKKLWGKGSGDTLLLQEKNGTIVPTMPLSVWSYLTQADFNMYHMEMGVWLETKDTYAEVYDADNNAEVYDADNKYR